MTGQPPSCRFAFLDKHGPWEMITEEIVFMAYGTTIEETFDYAKAIHDREI